ncbi:MAG TPA: dockerin type I repeat-containing protein [candidate division Zixibacteria bacterium]
MIKGIIIFTISLLLVLSLSVFGANKPADYKMIQKLESLDTICYTAEIPPIKYPRIPESKIKYLFSDDTVGYTYYDYQFNAPQHRQIASDLSGTLHFTWMDCISPDYYYGIRYIDYNARYSNGTWLNPGGVHITPDLVRGGYGGLDILPDNREVLCYHRPYGDDWGSTVSIEDSIPGSGQFNHFDIPDSVAHTSDKSEWPAIGCSKLKNGDTTYFHITHERSSTGCVTNKELGYVRCFEMPTNRDTLICQSPGWDSPLLIPKDTKLVPNKVPFMYAIAKLGSGVIATSPVSQKVCIAWLQYTSNSATKNEVMYLESTNNGNDWMAAGNMGTPVQITSYGASGFRDRAYCDIAAVYDYNDELHIMWTTFTENNSNDVTLWHWSSITGIRKVSSAFATSSVDPGAWNLLIAKFTLGVGSDPSDTAFNYLYVNYTKFKEGDISAGGFANGDVCAKASSNGGLTWGQEINLTNTNSNGCAPGDCESEHWPSLAERVDSFLYVQYIYDRDAGGIPNGEGTHTNNPVRYLKYPRFLVPAIPHLSFTPDQMTDPIRWATKDGITSDSMLFSNEDGTADLYVKLSGPSWVIINPYNFNIAEGGPAQAVNITFNGAGFADTLLVDSLKVLSNHGLTGGGEVYADTKWVKVHFVVTNEFYYPEYDTINTQAMLTTVSNVGNLGNQEDSGGMFYNGHDYLYDFSPVVLVNMPGSSPPEWHASTRMYDNHDLLPESHLQVTDYPNLRATMVTKTFAPTFPRLDPPWHCYWPWWTIQDKSIFFWKPARVPTKPIYYERAILKYTKFFKNPPPPWWYDTWEPPNLPSTYLGFAGDWDVPSEAYDKNIGGYGDIRGPNNLIWLYADTSAFHNYYAGFRFCYAERDGDTSFTPFGAHVLSNATQIGPFGGYNDDSLYKYMSTPGWSVESDSAQNMNILVSGIELIDPPPTTQVTMKYALLVTDQDKADFESLATQLGRAKCGDANVDGNVTVSDVVYLINYLFKGGPEPWMYFSDASGDGKISVSDAVYLINYLFKGGSPPRCDYPGFAP